MGDHHTSGVEGVLNNLSRQLIPEEIIGKSLAN